MITVNQVEKYLKLNRKQISVLGFVSSKLMLAKQIVSDQPTDVMINNLPSLFNAKELVQQLVTKPLQIDGEQLYFKTIEDGQLLLANDFNKKITRACISIWEDKQLIVITAVVKELRNSNYRSVCVSLLNSLQQENQVKEDTVQFKNTKVNFLKKITKRKHNQHTCVVLCNYNQDAGDDQYNQPSIQLVKQVHATCQAYKDQLYTTYAFNNTTPQIIENLQQDYFYLDKINILDSANDNLENSYPEAGRLFEIFIFNQGDELVQQISIREAQELKKLQVDLHQRLVNLSFIKLTSPEMNYLDLTDDKRLSVDGFAFNYRQKVYKYNKQPVLILRESDVGTVAQVQQLCKQFNVYLIVQTNENPEEYKNVTIVQELPYVIKDCKYIYSDGVQPHYLENLQEFIPLAQRYQQQVQSINEETQEELELDEAEMPELRFQNTEGSTGYVTFRGYNFSYIQQPTPYKEKQFVALVFIDANQLDFEYQLEQAYLFQNKCPEIYMVYIIRGITNELYLKQKMTRTSLLTRLNILQYKSGFIKALRKFEKYLQHMMFIYDNQMRFYGRQFSIIEALREYKDILEDLTNQKIYNERKTAKMFFYNTPAINQYVFQGQILKTINVAKPYLKQALIAMFFITVSKNARNTQILEQDLLYNLNQALDTQKTGMCFVLVCVENVTIANLGSYMERYPVMKQLNILSDKDVISKIRFVNKVIGQEEKYYFVVDQLSNCVKRFSFSAMVKRQVENEDNNGNFMHDDTNQVESVIYNDLVFQYVQKVRQRQQHQGLCLVYLECGDKDKLAANVQRVCALQEKYPEVSFDVCLIGYDVKQYRRELFSSVYYFDLINIVGDTPDSHSIAMRREDFSYYLYDNNFELLKKNVAYSALSQDIVQCFGVSDERTSFYDAEITENDKSLVIGGQYIPYIRRVQHKSRHKVLITFMLNADDDRFPGYLKQIDEVRKVYQELYVVAVIQQLDRESYVGMLERYPVLNKFNILSNENYICERHFGQHPGKPLLCVLGGEVYSDFGKLLQALQAEYIEKDAATPQEIVFKGQRCQYLQQAFERHRKQLVLICCIPKDEQVESRIQQLYQLQVIYPEVYFVYYIEQTDIVSIQAYKKTVFKFSHINIVKNVIMEGKGLQFYLLNNKFEQKLKMKTINHLKQELRKLQFDLSQQRECIVPCIDCQLEDRINYYGRTLEYYKKNYKNEDQNVGIVLAVLDPQAPNFAQDCEDLNRLRKQHLKYSYFMVSLRNCTFEEARGYINNDMNLMEMNVVASIPEYLIQGTEEYRFELHSHMLIQRADVRLFNSVQALQNAIVREGFIQHYDISDEECYLDYDHYNDAFYCDQTMSNRVIFRGTQLNLIQVAESYKPNDNAMFTYIDQIGDEFMLEHRLKVVYELQQAYTGHYLVVCIRGITNTIQLNNLESSHYVKELNIAAYKSGFSKMFTSAEKERRMCTFYFQPKIEAVDNRRVTRFAPAELANIAQLDKHTYTVSLLPETPDENQMVVNGLRHHYVQRVTEYNIKYRYVLCVYCTGQQFKSTHQYLNDIVQTRDDVYVTVCVQDVNDLAQLTQKGAVNKELNILDDQHGVCSKVFYWYAEEYSQYYDQVAQKYRAMLDRYEQLKTIRSDIESEDERQNFTEEYNVIEPRDPKLSKQVDLVVMLQDASYPQNVSVGFQIPSVIQFTSEHGMSGKQLELEKDKIAGSSIKIDTIEFNLIQKQSNKSINDIKQSIIVFLDTKHPNFSLDINNLHQMDVQTPKVLLAVCLMGVTQLSQEHFSLAYNLQNMNIVADRQCKYEKSHMQYYVMLPSGEFVPNIGNVSIDKLQTFNKVVYKPTKYDVKGDKQLLFNGAIYTYLRRILFKSINGAAVFAFVRRDSERFEQLIQQLHDSQLKYPDVAIVLFIQELSGAELQTMLSRYPQLFNVNLGEDKHNLCSNMLSRSATGIMVVGWSGNGKEVQMEETAKLDQTIVSFGVKGVSVKADEKLVLKAKPDTTVTFTYIQKIYQRRGTSQNAAANQRVCLCMIPSDGKYYNDMMVYYTYTMQVRFPEIYFVICFPGQSREQIMQLFEKFSYLERMNIVESPQAASLLHECNQNDVDNEGLPEGALGTKIYTFKLFDGLCREDTSVSGTPQDEIFAEFVVDKFSTREHLRYLSPAINVQPDRFIFKGCNMQYLNRSNISKYDPEKIVLFVKVAQNDKFDLVCKQFIDLMRQKQNVYFVFNIDKITKDTLKIFLQQKPQAKILNIVTATSQDELYPLTVDIGANKNVQLDFNVIMQLPTFDFYDKLYAQIYGTEQLPISQKAQILGQFIDKVSQEFQDNHNYIQDAANLDIEPPLKPAGAEEEDNETKYDYYDRLMVSQDKVVFRYYELKYLQKVEDFSGFLSKKQYCLVTLSKHAIYDDNLFEKNVREIYMQAQAQQDVGYMLLIENLYDTANLFKYSQQAYYLDKLVVLEYKFGLNQLLRAPGEFVCDRIVQREMIFNRHNRFYYQAAEAKDDEGRVVCSPIVHRKNNTYVLAQTNDTDKLLINTPNQNYLVLYGILYKVIRRPEAQSVFDKKLFVFIREESPAIIDVIQDSVRRLKANIYIVCTGITEENVNGFCKKYPLIRQGFVLSDENNTVVRVMQYAKKFYNVDNQIVLLKVNMEDENNVVFQWSDKFDEIGYQFDFKQEAQEDDDWWCKEAGPEDADDTGAAAEAVAE